MKEFTRALEYLEEAKKNYIDGFNEQHPKVAWAYEAMGNCYRKMGNLRQAQEMMDQVVIIRAKLMEGAEGKELFAKEMEKTRKAVEEIEARRAEIAKTNKSARMKLKSLRGFSKSPLLPDTRPIPDTKIDIETKPIDGKPVAPAAAPAAAPAEAPATDAAATETAPAPASEPAAAEPAAAPVAERPPTLPSTDPMAPPASAQPNPEYIEQERAAAAKKLPGDEASSSVSAPTDSVPQVPPALKNAIDGLKQNMAKFIPFCNQERKPPGGGNLFGGKGV